MPQIAVTNDEYSFPHLLYLPETFAAQEEWPLIVFLHGVGERGTDPNLVRKYALPKYLDEEHELPAMVVSPQCPLDTKWDAMPEKVLAFVEEITATQPVNTRRISLTGFSMGGRGTWALATYRPHQFSAYAPVAGRIPPQEGFLETLCVLKDKPLWVFHGAADERVEVENSDILVQHLRDCGASNLQYTCYPDAGHGETSNLTYWNQELYDWLLRFDHTD